MGVHRKNISSSIGAQARKVEEEQEEEEEKEKKRAVQCKALTTQRAHLKRIKDIKFLTLDPFDP